MLAMLSAFRAKDRLLKILAGACKSVIAQLAREGSPPPGLRRPQAKLSRNSNQLARGRIRRFESYMPSHAVRSLRCYFPRILAFDITELPRPCITSVMLRILSAFCA